MNPTKFSIQRNRVVLSVLVAVILAGIAMYQNLSRDSMPPYTVRVASIVSSFPGASPERVELLVSDKIEKVAQELPELKKVTSTSRTGLSVVNVELRMEVKQKDLQDVWDRLRRKLETIEGLPENVYPQLKDDGLGEVFGIALGLTSDGFDYAELKDYADDIRNDLIKLEDAAKVELNGTQEERVYIYYNDAKLATYGLTSSRLYDIISSTNILNTGGKISVEEERITLEPSGNFNAIEDIKETLIPVRNSSQVVALSDIAEIRKGYISPATQLVRIDGKEAVSLHVSLKDGANILSLGENCDVLIKKWQEKLPVGLELKRISSIDTYIDSKVGDFVNNLIQAIIIVLAVMLFFLGLRTGLVIASLIPIVTITTLLVMGLIDVGINQITLAALIMALGMMVDNGIVVAESIMVKVEGGEEIKDAAISSCSELMVPLFISTLTTSAAFLPFYLAESVMGDIMGPLFVVISIALLSSWLISLSIITLFSVYFLKVGKKDQEKRSIVDRTITFLKTKYLVLILKALQWKKSVVFGVVVLFFLSIVGFGLLSVVFFPDSDRNMITVDINLPEGTRLEATTEIILDIERYIKEELLVNDVRTEGIVDWSSFIGKGPSSYDLGYTTEEANSNYAHILVNTTSFEVNGLIIEELDEFCFNSFPNANVKIGRLGGGGGGAPIEIRVSGEDPDKLLAISGSIKQKLFESAGTKNIKDDWGLKTKKFIVDIDVNRAQNAGITNQDIAISLQTVLDGYKAGEFREGNKNIPIVLKGELIGEQNLGEIETMSIYSQSTGSNIPLSQVASIIPYWQYSNIERLNLEKTISITSELTEDGNAAEITNAIMPWLESQSKEWGDDYTFSLGGDSEESAENMGAVGKYLPLAGFIILMLLIIQFNSIRKTTIVVSTIPLGVIGMVLGLLVFQVSFGFMAFLGVISLAGIVINNGIVLIDRIEIEDGKEELKTQDAIIIACLQRFRPILLATFTTVLGLIPLYLGGGDIWRPMAVTIMIGLLFGTIITLLFVPSFYSILFRVSYKDYTFNDELLEE